MDVTRRRQACRKCRNELRAIEKDWKDLSSACAQKANSLANDILQILDVKDLDLGMLSNEEGLKSALAKALFLRCEKMQDELQDLLMNFSQLVQNIRQACAIVFPEQFSGDDASNDKAFDNADTCLERGLAEYVSMHKKELVMKVEVIRALSTAGKEGSQISRDDEKDFRASLVPKIQVYLSTLVLEPYRPQDRLNTILMQLETEYS